MKLSIVSVFFLFKSTEQWLSITQITNLSLVKDDLCQHRYGLHRRQIRFCQRNEHLMPFIHFGARLALEECQVQFQHRHWNCTLFHNNQLIGNILDAGTKESGYIHALTSAGIAYAITKACSTGRLRSCGCDMTMKDGNIEGSIRWTGCSDNVLFGTEIARKFVNLRERKKTSRTSLLNLHNNQVGIRTILSSVARQCKCHGVSGSCEFQSCWRSLHSFSQITNQLKEFYDNSIQIHLQRNFADQQFRFRPKNIPYQNEQQSFSINLKNHLIFRNPSPNYCESNFSIGSLGTIDRLCNRNSRAIDSCDILCCNRGYRSQLITRQEQCNCRFQWCCHVQCQICLTTDEISRCL